MIKYKNINRVFNRFGNCVKDLMIKSRSKTAVAFGLIAVMLTGLVLPTLPVNAVSLSIVDFPYTMTQSDNDSFTSQITIDANERIPVDSIRLDLMGPTDAYAVFNTDGAITSQSGQFVSVVPQGTPNYNFGSLSASGYGYSSGSNTVDLSIDANENCFNVYYGGSSWGSDNGSIDVTAGYYSPHYQKSGSGMRFANANIPQGAVITSAYLTFTSRLDAEGTTTRTMVVGDKEADAAPFSTLADYQSRRGTDVGGIDNSLRTNAEMIWDNIGPWLPGNQYRSPDISSVVQEIVDQPDWTSGNHLALFWDDHEGRSDIVNYAARDGYSYRGSNTESPELHIKYVYSGSAYYQPSWGSGIGYGGSTTLQYLVTVNTNTMQVGNYNAQLSVNVPPAFNSSFTKFLSYPYSFDLISASNAGSSTTTSTLSTSTTLNGTLPWWPWAVIPIVIIGIVVLVWLQGKSSAH